MSIVDVKVPVLSESVADATVLEWYKKAGDALQEGDKLVDIETDKVVLEVVAPKAGVLTSIVKDKGASVLSEELLGSIDTTATATTTSPVAAAPVATAPAAVASSADPKTSPAVRKMATEQGINPADVPHSGDRVTKSDMLAAGQKPATVAPKAPPLVGSRPEERVAMTRMRKRTAERLLEAQHQHALLTTFNEINMKPMMDLRTKYKDEFEKKHGAKLGFMSFFTKATVAALQKFPIVNASTEGDDIIYHGYYDIGIAVSSQRGLVVPILRDADALSFADIEKGIADFGKRARDAKLTIEELTGGTFSITNGGIFGSMMSTPILNPPQSAILGMHNIVDRPYVENGQVVVRPVMYVALTYDHRIIDGRDAVQFLVAIKNAIEDPARLLLEV
ncbi:2-oxoglutarate dehydrogenase complex dihydrolipoyllysine-residue succinyltransferase [Beggiatoa leptomitoformis]|uniref:Dihydrolipoyllysine-residue succinyltransferase component of 2-oxoglutarate dehydrogenase complex n=1 Tax=Beggiatoa leptomitoformis TaxID=288004 RepID=A0A2N9YB66_9GAMM|nr:2-oxoglutarate dehydrogenase complex dihydrolipoyllysine-residue succinyltransferase [Beggiatoa leptomitoformis]ALG66921.1 2-oxoglutarate dehydrogenase complex dihydrolipoyllysine-residue succinyltransferase [Beggiatoa leptomitoformis]AUI67713.1 2-oxoglutarate dehydrogenase complex dihydrolipoyllysine-residue succinyltransferase [Beggiatoa leptomitoformis]